MREIIFDTETTGLDPAGGDRLVEIGCVELFKRRPTGITVGKMRVSQGDFSQQLAVAYADNELGQIGNAYNRLLGSDPQVLEFKGGDSVGLVHARQNTST